METRRLKRQSTLSNLKSGAVGPDDPGDFQTVVRRPQSAGSVAAEDDGDEGSSYATFVPIDNDCNQTGAALRSSVKLNGSRNSIREDNDEDDEEAYRTTIVRAPLIPPSSPVGKTLPQSSTPSLAFASGLSPTTTNDSALPGIAATSPVFATANSGLQELLQAENGQLRQQLKQLKSVIGCLLAMLCLLLAYTWQLYTTVSPQTAELPPLLAPIRPLPPSSHR